MIREKKVKNPFRRGAFRATLLLLALAGLVSRCVAPENDVPPPFDPPAHARNVILLIGDGMGEGQRQATRWFSKGIQGRLFIDLLPVQGWCTTAAANNAVTDSAAAATAMACGVKTNNGVIGMTPTIQSIVNILEEARQNCKSVGLITTSQLTSATPAAFIAHVPSRTMENEIALAMIASGADVLIGGGENRFLPKGIPGCYPAFGKREDGRNLIEEARSAGYTVACSAETFTAVDPAFTPRLFAVLADELLLRPYNPGLAAMTEKAIAILSLNPNGFFLMIEAGQIDTACHDHDAQSMIADTLGLDETVELVWRFAEADQNTLVITTADHETGGVTVSLQPAGTKDESGPFVMPDGISFWVGWSSSGHTAADVALNAGGPFCGELSGTYANTHVFTVMHKAVLKQ